MSDKYCNFYPAAGSRRPLALKAPLAVAIALLTAQARGQGYAPDVAASKMTVAPGFGVDLVAAEPHVRQPVCIEFDDRGRLWVVQYLQYPNPAGLKRVKVDRYSRTVYDRVPEPPPRGPRGADRITILEDTDGDGRIDRSKDFVAGLNLATGVAFGYGGVFVLQVPYLLFYPDRNHDDVPDGDPEVLLTGFGMEDTSSLVNSLTWGPDGWLYGTQGTNLTAHIRGADFEQGVWRYHPRTHEFELFCEGGGNSWGLDFDEAGNLFFGTNYGGYLMHHAFQGAYYEKQFAKHGELHNPFAFGYFPHVPHHDFQGGHVTVGGIVYQEDLLPPALRGKYIAADTLGHAVRWHTFRPDGSTFRTANGGVLLQANDAWFAPSDVTAGPDGAVYVSDWFDKRTAHPDPDADWDRSNGRVYRIHPARMNADHHASAPRTALNSDATPTPRLIECLRDTRGWHARRALRLLAERRDPKAVPLLREMLDTANPMIAPRVVCAIYVSGGFDESLAMELLDHPVSSVRMWTIRFLGDQRNVGAPIEDRLLRLADSEKNPSVLAQLACSAKRLPALCGLRIAARLAENPISAKDRSIPLLVWWAVENGATVDRDFTIRTFASPHGWQVPLIRDTIIGRLVRRFAAEGTLDGSAAAARILAGAPSYADERPLLGDVDEGLKMIGRHGAKELPLGTSRFGVLQTAQHVQLPRMPAARSELKPLVDRIVPRPDEVAFDPDPLLLRVACRLGSRHAYRMVLAGLSHEHLPPKIRRELLHIVAEMGAADAVPAVLGLLQTSKDESVRSAALETLAHFDDPQIPDEVIRLYPRLSVGLKTSARNLLFGRRDSARRALAAIDQGRIPADDVPTDDLRRIAVYNDPELDAAVRKRWGNMRAGTPEEKLADIRRLSNDLRATVGRREFGHELFKKNCGNCHALFGEGNKIGPDLTAANRKDREFLLVSIVDPNAQVRKEFLAYVVRTNDGRILTGLIAEQTPSAITLVGAKNERTTIPRSEIEELKESPISLMPERLLDPLKPQEVRDLFSYLESK